MSFLSTQRLHWGEHDALTGHFWTHLEMHVHDLPLHSKHPDSATRTPNDHAREKPGKTQLHDLMPDVPGP